MGETIESLRQERDKAEAALARELAAREAAEKEVAAIRLGMAQDRTMADVAARAKLDDIKTLKTALAAAEKENTSLRQERDAAGRAAEKYANRADDTVGHLLALLNVLDSQPCSYAEEARADIRRARHAVATSDNHANRKPEPTS